MKTVTVVYDTVTCVIRSILIDADVKLGRGERKKVMPSTVYRQLGSPTAVAAALALKETE